MQLHASFRGAVSLALVLSSLGLSAAVASATPQAPPPAPVAAPAAPAAAARTPVGSWQGMVLAGNGALFVRLDVRQEGDHGAVQVTLPQANALKQDAVEVELAGSRLGLTLKAAGISGRFDGEVAEDGATLAGELTLTGGQGDPLKVPFTLGRTGDAKTTPGAEQWEGTLDVGGAKLPFAVTLATHPNFGPLGAIDIPMQSLEGFPLLVSEGEGGKRTMRIPVGMEAVIEVAPKDGKLVGEMRQGAMTIPVTLSRKGEGAVTGLARPQLPTPPFPYTVREVTIPHRFGHSLAGTLTMPKRERGAAAGQQPATKFPAVVLVTGSGPQDRDETIFGHKPFLVIADALTRAGIAVLRYDDRGVGKSTGSFASATTHDFATDCDEATEWLRSQVDIDPTRIGIIGHSEGGMIAPMVAKWQWEEGNPDTAVRFVVLLAGPGVSGRDILAVQMRKLMQAEGATPDEIEAVSALQIAAMDAVRAEKTNEEITPFVRALVAKQLDVAQAHGKLAPGADMEALTTGAVAEMGSGWMRTFVAHDPRTWIAALPIPVLAMQGGKDLQVDADQNIPAIEAAAKEGGVPLTIKRYPNLNHLFQPATSGAVEEYGTIETTFDPQALKDLVDWITKTVKDPSLATIKPKHRSEPAEPIMPDRVGASPDAKPDAKPDTKPDAKPNAKPDTKPDAKPASAPNGAPASPPARPASPAGTPANGPATNPPAGKP